MKRTREGEVSPYAATFEIIEGLTKTAYDATCASWRVGERRLCSPSFSVADTVRLPNEKDPFSLFAARRKLFDRVFLSDLLEQKQQNPTLINTIELFLHQGEVDARTGARCFPGDVIAYTPEALISAPRVRDVQFITYQAEAFTDVESWADAVKANLACVARWVGQLASQPPGLARLSFVAGAALGLHGKGTEKADLTDGWWRSLQLPLLLHTSPSLQGKLDKKVVLQLQHCVVSVLRIYVDLFQHTGSIFHQPHLINCLAGEFFISPLFVEGFSMILPQVAGSLVSSVLRSATKSLQDAIRLFLSFQSTSVAAELACTERDKYKSVVWSAASNSFEVLVHALSTAWLSSSKEPAAVAGGGKPIKDSNVVAEQMLEEVAGSGVFHSVVQWLQKRQDTTSEQSDAGFFKRLLAPPSLRDVRALYGLTSHAITENLDVMKKTNTPYLTKDAIRFLEALASAAHAELYGASSRAVKQALERFEINPSYVPEEDATLSAARIQSVTSSTIRTDLAAYTASEVRHSEQFGLPLAIKAVLPHRMHEKESSFLHTVKRTSGSEGCSTFLYALVRLQGRFSLFPLIVTQAEEAEEGKEKEEEEEEGDDEMHHLHVCAHVLRDVELFPEFVYLGAQMSPDGRPDAWLITEESIKSLDSGDTLNHAKTQASLLGKSCPAISHMDLLRRSAAVHASLKDLVNKPSREVPRTSALREAATAQAFATASSLWMDYFATGRPSPQVGLSSLSPASLATLSGTTNGEAIIQDLVKDTPFTPAQVEALSVLATHVIVPNPKEPLEREQNYLHLVDGVVGSGKSSVLRASGVVKGKMLSAARKEHFGSLQESIKEATHSLQQVGAPLLSNTDVEQPPVESIELTLSELANTLETQTVSFVQLSNGLKCSTTPLLVRCAAPPSQDATAQAEGIQDPEEGLERSMSEVAREGFARALKAPLMQQFSHVWKTLQRRSAQLARMQQQQQHQQQQEDEMEGRKHQEQRRLHVPLTGYTLATRNIVETLSAAVEKKCASWSAYLSGHLWPAGDIREALGSVPEADIVWPMHASPEEQQYEAVLMPEATLFSKMETGSAHGWLTVLEQKEKTLRTHLAEAIHHWAHFFFSCVYDLAIGVTSVSHFGKYTLLSCTPEDTVQEGLLPLLWAYRPTFLLIDDAEYLQDGAMALLTPANQITLSFSSEMPPWQERQRHLCGAVMRGLRHDLQKPSAVSTVSLHDPIRCQRPEVSGALLQLCADVPFESFSHLVDATTATTDEEPEGEQKPLPPAFPGLVSCSGMEMWTHAVPLKLGPHADLVAAIFVARYLGSYASEFIATPSPTIVLCTAFADEYTRWQGACAQTPLQVSCVPFDDTTQPPHGADMNADIILVSLSGFAHRLCPPSENKSAEARQRRWNEVLDTAAKNSFLDRFQSWLWRVLRRAKTGAILIGSAELATHIPLLRMFHEYIKQQRLALTNKGAKATYWVPEDAASAVLALRCPDHHKCRRTATIRVGASKKGCEIFLDGIPRCGLLCLKPYEGCTSYSHACLEPCHLQQAPGANPHEEPHAHCPYPCGKKLECGHVCHRTCGEECGSCNFVGLRELPCGQRVLCGVGPDQTLRYEFIPHFKKSSCEEGHVQCEEEVFVPCPRCGTKVFVPCFFYTQYNARLQEALKEKGEDALKHVPNEGTFSVTERQCAGCVTLFNRICVKYGFDVLDLPPVHIPVKKPFNLSGEVDGEGGGEHEYDDGDEDDVASELAVEPGSLPRHLLSAEAQEELRQRFTLASKMAELRAMKEAGEITSENPAAAASQYVKLKAKYDANKAQHEKEEESYQAELHVTAEEWAQRLRKRLDQQVALNEEVESMIPLLLSNASEEGKRQREFPFS